MIQDGIEQIMAVLHGAQCIAYSRRSPKARTESHGSSPGDVPGKQWIVVSGDYSLATGTVSRSGMSNDLTQGFTDKVRFLAEAPEFFWTKQPYATGKSANRVVRAWED
jgi:hypothetical protein